MKDGIPNFDQFVDYLLFDYKWTDHDYHLEFYWWKCDMCKIHYDVIGKVETSEEDMRHIFHKVNKQWYQLCPFIKKPKKAQKMIKYF